MNIVDKVPCVGTTCGREVWEGFLEEVGSRGWMGCRAEGKPGSQGLHRTSAGTADRCILG